MRYVLKDNFTFAVAFANASHAIGEHLPTVVDHAYGPSATFMIDVSDVGTGGTLAAKLQYSDDGTNYTDYTSTGGNDTAITTITAAGDAILHIVNPLGRYTRCHCTVATDAVVFGVRSVVGPLRHVAPS
jgi:hypothetical protein